MPASMKVSVLLISSPLLDGCALSRLHSQPLMLFFLFFGAGARKHACHCVVSFLTCVFKYRTSRLSHRNFDLPGFGPGRRVFHGDLIHESVRIRAREALDKMKILA